MESKDFIRVDGTNVWLDCRLTLISRPSFENPLHLPVAHPDRQDSVSDGDRLSEFAGRLCYMSQNNPAERTTSEYVYNILRERHGSVLEHQNYSILVEGVSRSASHEWVRHRAGWAYSQLSQRYVGADHVAFVVPVHMLQHHYMQVNAIGYFIKARAEYANWVEVMGVATPEKSLSKRDRQKLVNQNARFCLPNATETKFVATANARAWRTFLELRGAPGAEPEIRRAAVAAARILKVVAPATFQDLEIIEDDSLPSYPFRLQTLHNKV